MVLNRYQGLRLRQRMRFEKSRRFLFRIEISELAKFCQGPGPIAFGVAQRHYDDPQLVLLNGRHGRTPWDAGMVFSTGCLPQW